MELTTLDTLRQLRAQATINAATLQKLGLTVLAQYEREQWARLNEQVKMMEDAPKDN